MEGASVGLVVVGLGSVGSSLIAGVLAAREHLVHPFGSLVEAGGAGRASGTRSLRDEAPLAELTSLALGAFELHDDDAHRAALRAGVLNRSLVDELRPQLRSVRAMIGVRHAPTRRHLADALAEDLRGFLAHNRCKRGVVVCTLPGLQSAPAKLGFTAGEVWTALEEGAAWVTPAVVYAAAAAQAGCAFVAAGRDAALCAPGIPLLFEEQQLAIAGTGLLGPETALREALAQVLAGEGLQLTGSASLSTRAEEQGARLWGGHDRTEEMGHALAWAGGALELSIELRGQISLYLAARALDASLLVDLAARAARNGSQPWLDALFTTPLGSSTPQQAAATTLAGRRARLRAELPALAKCAG